MTETKQKSDLSRAFSEDGTLKTHVGGQALLEGIMMRGKYNWSVAVREPDGGIYTEEHDLASGKDKNGWLYWPLVRGVRAFVESLALGYKALTIAAEHAFVEEDDQAESPAKDGASDCPSLTDYASDDGGLAAQVPDCAEEGEGGLAAQPADFSWERDFGNPDEVIDALGAQRTFEVVVEYDAAAAQMDEASAGEDGLPTEDAAAAQMDDALAGEDASATDGGLPAVEGELPTVQEEAEIVSKGSVPFDTKTEAPEAEKKPLLGDKEMAISMALGLVLGIVLFVVAPAAITNLIVGEYDQNTLVWNIVDGILRIAVFIFYIWLIGRMEDIKRMFGYHGAEHKTIHCFEHGLPLTPENARSFPRLHVRCGTAFLIMVMIIAIFVYTVTPLNALIGAWGVPDGVPKLVLVIVVRILLMPVIAGVAYEITVKWAGSHPENPLVKVVLWPGMQMQYLTTREPDDGQIECAIAAMQLVLAREQREEAAAAAE